MAAASYQDLLSAVRTKFPQTVVDQGLITELKRRAAEGATVDQVVNDAAGYSQTQTDPNAGVIQPITPQQQQGFVDQARNIVDPGGVNTQAFNQGLQAKLKQTLRNTSQQVAGDLSNRGFLRSGEQIDTNSLQAQIAASDLALQQANYGNTMNQAVGSEAATLEGQQSTINNQNAQAQLQNLVQGSGISQQLFNNAQALATQQLNQAGGINTLLANPDFTYLATSQPNIVKALLASLGVNWSA